MQFASHLFHSTLFALVVIILLSSSTSSAQRVDHKGREFRIVFMPTDGPIGYSSFLLDISCDKPTSGTLTYENSGTVQLIQIPTANQPVVVRLDSIQLILPNPHSVEISHRTLRLRFNDEVTVHGINTQRWSSDGFLALPTDVLANKYYVLAYPNTVAPDVADTSIGRSDFPSQFAIIGMKDGTTVNIHPTGLINNQSGGPFNITLQAGEVFLAQATGKAGVDLTGTLITASNPVAVFSGHQRANVPWDDAVGRDHLVEQLPPVERWERSAIVIPPFRLKRSIPDTTFARILAAEDGTTVSFGDSTHSLNRGERRDVVVTHPAFVSADKPILVAQFQHSSVAEAQISVPTDSIGDPFMALMPSPEQFMENYVFESYSTPDFLQHYATVVLPTAAMFTMIVDGAPMVPEEFDIVTGAPYVCAHLELRPGYHTISAARPFGVMVYGYGPYNSYGFPAGMTFEPIPLGVDAPADVPLSPALITRLIGENLEVVIEGRGAAVALFDVLGRQVRSVTSDAGAGRVNFNVADLPAGIYFCRALLADGEVRVAGVVIP